MLRLFSIIAGVSITLWVAGLLAFIAYSMQLHPLEPDTKTDAIIVLTGGGARIENGLQLWSEGMAKNLFITGVHPNVPLEKITSLWTQDAPLPECCITLGHKAVSTFENAQETRDWIEKNDIKSIRLVTSEYHMARSALEFRNAIPNIKIIEHPIEQKDFEPWSMHFWKIYLSEYHKIILRYAQQFFEHPTPLKLDQSKK